MRRLKIKNKRGQDWTIGKLMTLILVVVFLVLIVYGISTGGLKPLFAKIANSFDNILVMLGIKNAKSSTTEIETTATIYGLDNQRLRVGDNWCVAYLDSRAGNLSGVYQVQFRDGDWKFDQRGSTGNSYNNVDYKTVSEWNLYERKLYQAMVAKFSKPKNYKIHSNEGDNYDEQTSAWMKYYRDSSDYYYAPLWLVENGLMTWVNWGDSGTFFLYKGNDEYEKDRITVLLEGPNEDVSEKDYNVFEDEVKTGTSRGYILSGLKNALRYTNRNCFNVNNDRYCPSEGDNAQLKFILDKDSGGGYYNPLALIQAKVPGSNNWYAISKKPQEWDPAKVDYTFYHEWSADQKTWSEMDVRKYYYIYAPDGEVPAMIERGKIKASLLKACQDS